MPTNALNMPHNRDQIVDIATKTIISPSFRTIVDCQPKTTHAFPSNPTTQTGYVHDGVDAATVSLPHRAEARLAADVPHLDRHVALGDFAHVEANGRDHVLAELAGLRGYNIQNKHTHNQEGRDKGRER